MELFRVGEALLRSPQPLLPFLAPSAYQRAAPSRRAANAISRHCRHHRPQCQTQRTFSTSPRHQQQSAAAAREKEPEEDYSTEDGRLPSQQPPPSPSTHDISSLLDGALDFNKGTPTAPATRTSRFKSPTAQDNTTPSRSAASSSYRPREGSSVEDLLSAMKTPSTSTTRSPGGSKNSLSSFMDIESLLNPPRSPNTAAAHNPPPPTTAVPDKPLPMKLGPSVGRTVSVDSQRGVDIGRAFRMLEMQVARNNVKKDFMRQRFHERPGLKRKRLKGERWRRRFKENFKGTVGMVQRMKAQGW